MSVYLLIDLLDKVKSIYVLEFHFRGTEINWVNRKGMHSLHLPISGISLVKKFIA